MIRLRTLLVLAASAVPLAASLTFVPTAVASSTAASVWESIDGGYVHTCGVRADGTAWCWGQNDYGQLGNGSQGESIPVPGQVGVATTWVTTDIGELHSCGVQSDASLWCWGYNGSGALGIGGTESEFTPQQVPGSWLSVSATFYHTCGVQTDNSLWCWGSNNHGELGGEFGDSTVPNQVGSGTDWATVSGGDYYTCGTQTSGSAWCWGLNEHGQLGDGTRTERRTPVQVGAATNWQSIAGGGGHTCGTRTTGTLWCWGDNSDGQLGDGTRRERRRPVQVGISTAWSTVDAGGRLSFEGQTCGVRSPGSLWCWGTNYSGQVGDGTFSNRKKPTRIGTAKTWLAVTTGFEHSCGTRANGSAWCWGESDAGQIGDGQFETRLVPTRVLD